MRLTRIFLLSVAMMLSISGCLPDAEEKNTALFSLLKAMMPKSVATGKLQSINVTPNAPSTALGFAKQLTATGSYDNGSSAEITSTVSWSSSDILVATVDAGGLVTPVSAGTATITATSGAIEGTEVITITSATLQSINVTPNTPSIVIGLTQPLRGIGSYNNGTSADITATVTWSSSDNGVATVDASGLVTAVGAGTATITATSGISGSATITVNAATLQSINVTPNAPSLVAGLTEQLTATGSYDNGSSVDLTATVAWSSSDNGVATVDAAGVVTAVGAGTATITATSGVSGTATITVNTATLQSINVTPNTPSLVAGLTEQLTATGSYDNGTSTDITATVAWSSSDNGVATVSATGLVTAVGAGAATITATLGISGTATITVNTATLQLINVTPTAPSLPEGLTQQLTATGSYDNGSSTDLTATVAWSSSDNGVATVDAAGVVTAVGAGTATITATSGITGTATITVNTATLQLINVTPKTPSLVAGLTEQLTATGSYDNGSSTDITATVAWTSSDNGVATVDAAGLVTAVGAGTATITATSGISGTATITVNTATLQSINVTPNTPSLVAGLTEQLTATGSYDNGSSTDITATVAWSSSDNGVATVDAAGVVTAVGAGTATITATSGITGTATITVNAATLQAINVAPNAPSTPVGLTQQLTATGSYDNGSSADITAAVAWSSSDNGVATVDASGLVTAVSAGTATITATGAGSVTGTTTITVTAPTLLIILVTPGTPAIVAGLTQQLTATGAYSDGSSADLTAAVTWDSSDNLVATVDASGLVTAIDAGTATITATSGLVSSSATVTVSAVTLQSISVTPNSTTVAEGLTQQLTATGSYSDGSTADLTATVTWSSDDNLVATVSASGLVTAIADGTATITAESGVINNTAAITVEDRAWKQDAYIKASNAGASDNFGMVVDIDGDTMVVSARLEDSDATGVTNSDGAHSDGFSGLTNDSGAVYVFKRNVAGEWIQDAFLKPSRTNLNDWFGHPVKISGDTIVASAYYEDYNATGVTNGNGSHSGTDAGANDKYGAVFVFQKDSDGSVTGTPGHWYQDAYLKASNAGPQDRFGSSLAIDGTTIIASANVEDSSATTITNTNGGHSDPGVTNGSGAVYVFKKDGSGNWYQDAYIKPSNTGDSDLFGYHIDISGTTIAASALRDDSDATGITNANNSHSGADATIDDNYGSVFVFQEDGSGNWYQDAYIKPSNAGAADNFSSLAIDGDTIVVGALGEDSDAIGITNSDGVDSGSDGGLTDNSGAAYVFKKDGSGNWYQDAYLKPSNTGATDWFGSSVGISGNMIVVDARQEDSDATGVTNSNGAHSGSDMGATDNSGAVYVFISDPAGDWYQDAFFKASNTGAGDTFGVSVAISGDTIVVGSYLEDGDASGVTNYDDAHSGTDSGTANDSGAAYVFTR